MKVVLVTPNFHQPRGNTVTVQRLADKLEKLRIKTEIVSITDVNCVTTLPPADIIHGFHAYRFYQFKESLKTKIDSYIVTMTGTDLYQDLLHVVKRPAVIRAVSEAKAVHVFNDQAKQLLVNEIPEIEKNVFILPQGISEFQDTDFKIHKDAFTFLFVLPAGIRRVKNIPFAINSLKVLHEKLPLIRLLIVGPIIEEIEGQLVKRLVNENKDWVDYIGQVPYSKMGALYKIADVVLNPSHSEGQSTAVIEGMAAGLPVLVSGNQGNQSLVTHGQTGFIFDNQTEFLEYAGHLIHHSQTRKSLGKSAKQYATKYHLNTAEGETLLKVYLKVLGQQDPKRS